MKPVKIQPIQFCLASVVLLLLSGCSQTVEVARTIWGTSTRALEDARVDAIGFAYDCSFDECFDAVLSLAANEDGLEPVNDKVFQVFQKNRTKGYIVVMGVPGNVDTTEVGVFFSRVRIDETRIEISSLSSSAKRRLADILTDELDQQFTKMQ